MESPPSTFRKGIGVVRTSVHTGDGGKLAIPGPVAAADLPPRVVKASRRPHRPLSPPLQGSRA